MWSTASRKEWDQTSSCNAKLSIQTGPVLHSQEPCIPRRCWMICRIIKPNQFHHLPWVSRSLPAIWSTIQQTGLELADYRATCSRVESTQENPDLILFEALIGGVPLDSHEIWLQHSLCLYEISFMTFLGKCRICYLGFRKYSNAAQKKANFC